MFKSIKWKIKEHSDFVKTGLNHNLFKDFLSRKYRKSMYKIWDGLPLRKALSDGFIFSQDTPSIALREIFMEEIYNVKGFTPEKDQVVIDVGANYGDSSIWWSKKFGARVIAFEPLEDVYRILNDNIRLNNAGVITYNLALGNGANIKGKRNGSMLAVGGDTEIASSKLDDFKLEKVDLLKIDVEGFEYGVLNGSAETIKKFKPKIIIETHSVKLRRICHEFLSSMGYMLKVEGRTIISDSLGMDKVTNLFYAV